MLKLEYYRNMLGLSQYELAQKVNMTQQRISAYERGIREPDLDTLILFAKFFNITTNDLLGLSEGERYSPIVKANTRMIPLLGTVKAGYDYLAQQNYIGYIGISINTSEPENYFGLKVTGDSMEPVMYENDTIIVHQQSDVESGQIAIVLIGDEEATVKKIIKYEDHIELIAFNSYYPPKRLDKDANFKIIGRVIEARISKIFE